MLLGMNILAPKWNDNLSFFQKSPSSPNLPILYAFLFLVFTQFMWATLNATYHSRSGFQKINPHPLRFAALKKLLNSTQKLKKIIIASFFQLFTNLFNFLIQPSFFIVRTLIATSVAVFTLVTTGTSPR
jgi:hypothetical protein